MDVIDLQQPQKKMEVKRADPGQTKSKVTKYFETGLFLFTGEEMKISDRPTEGTETVSYNN